MMKHLLHAACIVIFLYGQVSTQAQNSEDKNSEAQNIWSAAEDGDVDALHDLVNAGGDVNALRPVDEVSPLSLAVRTHQLDAINWLLDNGADVNGEDGDGGTALIAAAFFGYSDIFKTLVDAGADLEKSNNVGLDPGGALRIEWEITNAVANDFLGLGLSEEEVIAGRTAILGQFARFDIGAAIVVGDLDALSFHVENGVDVNEGIGGISFLLIATLMNRADIVELLLAAGADVDEQNQANGSTALLAAGFLGFKDVAKVLINAGADPDISDYQGSTARTILELEYDVTVSIAAMLDLEVSPQEELEAGRTEIGEMLDQVDQDSGETDSY